ncbi:MAG: flavodoxin domain-containing protein [Eubacteriales bacterium]|nr:flavodoxin domain-containing protein [Eubacteriales bacterium]
MRTIITYFSGTGNTAAMAEAIAEAIGIEAIEVGKVTAKQVLENDIIILGCSAMGAEELDAYEMEPLFSEIENELAGKKVALFGSYDWGDGEWMRTWYDRCVAGGAEMIQEEGLIAHLYPEEDDLVACKMLGEKIKAM